MYPFGIGFGSITTSQKSCSIGKRKFMNLVDETLIKVGNELVWVWIIAIELKDKTILGIRISYVERSMHAYS